MGIRPNEKTGELFLSKLYLLSSQRGKGHGKEAMRFLEKTAREGRFGTITLTVYHKNLGSIRAYEKMGFKHTGSVKRDIGRGIVIHDLTMEKEITPDP